MTTIAVTVEDALELPDPDGCLRPGTKHGRLDNGNRYCTCEKHRTLRRLLAREQQRKHRGSAMPDGLGSGWHVGVNALPWWPLNERLRRAGLIEDGASAHTILSRPGGHPFPEELRLAVRCRDRGWLTLHEADRLCIRMLSVHPALVYGQAWHDLETGESL